MTTSASSLRRDFLSAVALVAVAPGPWLAGCRQRAIGPPATSADRVDSQWHRHNLVDGLLRPWLLHAPQPGGAFRTGYSRTWEPRASQTVFLVHQARLVYSMAIGHELTGETAYLESARRGASFLMDRMRDPVNGGCYFSVGADGRPIGKNKRAYDHTFALLALSELHRVSGDPIYREAALQLWRDIERGFLDPQGGMVPEASANFVHSRGNRTQNPVMHLFEALLALQTATGQAESAVRRLGEFVAYRLLQGLPESVGGGALVPEWYDDEWRPLPTKAAGGYIDLGHQFEWVHLMMRGASILPILSPVAERVLSFALAQGYDEIDGGCFNRSYPDPGAQQDRAKGWWQQAECLHALIVAARATGRADLWRRYGQTLELIRRQLVNPQGGWHAAYALPCATGGCRDEQPDPYHMVSLHRTALVPGV